MDENYDPEKDKENEAESEVTEGDALAVESTEENNDSTEEAVNVTENPVPSITEDVIKAEETEE